MSTSALQTAMFVDRLGVLWGGQALLPGVAAVVKRMNLAGVPVVAVGNGAPGGAALADQLAEHDAVLAADLAADEAAPAARRLPRPGMLLEAARDLGLDLVTSWFITADPALLKAAGQAACTGAVLIGADAPPAPILGLKIVAARDLADAPRVMVPDKGGCWHDHR